MYVDSTNCTCVSWFCVDFFVSRIRRFCNDLRCYAVELHVCRGSRGFLYLEIPSFATFYNVTPLNYMCVGLRVDFCIWNPVVCNIRRIWKRLFCNILRFERRSKCKLWTIWFTKDFNPILYSVWNASHLHCCWCW